MDILQGWLFNIFELTIFKRNRGLFPYPDNQIKKESMEEIKKQQKKFFKSSLDRT